MASEYRNYNLPFYIGWQLHFILRRSGISYQSFTSLSRVQFRVHGEHGIHNFVEDVIEEFNVETRAFRIKSQDIDEFTSELEIWGLSYVKCRISKNPNSSVKIKVYGRLEALNLFETYQRNSKLFTDNLSSIPSNQKEIIDG